MSAVRSVRGFTLVEALVALLVGWLIATLALGTMARQTSVQATLARRGEALASLRTARHVLGREIRWGDGRVAVGPDTLGIRAFRGTAWVCPSHGAGGDLVVLPTGVRTADPAKDSLWILDEEGAVHVLALVWREGASCAGAPGVPAERWRVSGTLPAGSVVVRWFERGSYHLSGGALRYRRGDGGRQPLTPESIETPGSDFASGAGAVRVELRVEGGRFREFVLPTGSAPGG